MVIPLFITLILAGVALTVSSIAHEEIECLAAKLIGMLLLASSLYFTPLTLKLVIFALLLGIHRNLYHSSKSHEM